MQGPNLLQDLTLICDAIRSAGDIAKTFTGPQAQRWDKPGGAGPVTEADLAVNAHLLDTLRNARPHYGWLSEETEDSDERHNREHVFIIDPIDGTRNFIEGGQSWAHSIAIARGGEIVAGAIYLPMRDRLYAAARGHGATLNGAPLQASTRSELSEAVLLSAKPLLQPKFWTNGDVPEFARAYRPSLAYRMALVGQGRFDGMLTFRPTWEWDIAAGVLIAEEAGAKTTDRDGKPLRFNNPDPRTHGIVAAAPQLHSTLLARHIPNA